MSKRALLHCLFAFLLLVAQHGALTHSVWHLGDRIPGAVQAEEGHATGDRGGDSRHSKLCDLHFLLGSVLSGDCAALGTAPVPAMAVFSPGEAATEAVTGSGLTPPSRAPPVLL